MSYVKEYTDNYSDRLSEMRTHDNHYNPKAKNSDRFCRAAVELLFDIVKNCNMTSKESAVALFTDKLPCPESCFSEMIGSFNVQMLLAAPRTNKLVIITKPLNERGCDFSEDKLPFDVKIHTQLDLDEPMEKPTKLLIAVNPFSMLYTKALGYHCICIEDLFPHAVYSLIGVTKNKLGNVPAMLKQYLGNIPKMDTYFSKDELKEAKDFFNRMEMLINVLLASIVTNKYSYGVFRSWIEALFDTGMLGFREGQGKFVRTNTNISFSVVTSMGKDRREFDEMGYSYY